MSQAAQHPGRLAVGLGRIVLAGLAAGLRVWDLVSLVPKWHLARAYLSLIAARWRRSPYRWDDGFETRLAMQRAGVPRRALTFGHTPVGEAIRLLRWAGVGAGGCVFDAGAGRGEVLLAARRLGAEARGVELVRAHVEVAGPVLAEVGAELSGGDAAEAPLSGVTHVYAAWTLWPEDARARFVARWASLPTGARVLTLSEPVDDEAFEQIGARAVLVPWGPERAYLARRV